MSKIIGGVEIGWVLDWQSWGVGVYLDLRERVFEVDVGPFAFWIGEPFDMGTLSVIRWDTEPAPESDASAAVQACDTLAAASGDT